MAEQAANIRWAYQALTDSVRTALRTQLGDEERLGRVRANVLSLADAAQQVSS